MNVHQIRRWALNQWLRGVRLPLTLAETIGRRRDDRSWPPTLAFATFEGAVKEMVGRATGDTALLELAAMQRAEVALRRRSVDLEADATSQRLDARRDAEAAEVRLARQREDASRQAHAREAQAAADRQEAKRALDARTAAKRSANVKVATTQKKAVEKQATQTQAARLRTNAQALQAKEKAVVAQGKVIDLGKAAQAKKAARRSR